jgi:hypothetical protein
VLFEFQRTKNDKIVDLNMRVEEFDSKDALFDYISNGKYGQPDHPGICFGFRVFENTLINYELELFF